MSSPIPDDIAGLMTDAPAQPASSTTDYGPDASKTPVEPPKVNQKNPPKPVADVLKNLGKNKKVRGSDARRLTKTDREKIVSWYMTGSFAAMMFRPKASQIMALSAEDAADSVINLAEQNDHFRLWVLRFIEGGAVGAFVALHAPMALALLIPDSFWERDDLPPMLKLAHPDVMIASLQQRQAKRDEQSAV